MYSETEHRKIHRNFYHPLTNNMYAVIKRAETTTTHAGLYSTLENIFNTCDVCQRNSTEPHRFRGSILAEYCVFNRNVSMDIMKLDASPVLHVVDRSTKFGRQV